MIEVWPWWEWDEDAWVRYTDEDPIYVCERQWGGWKIMVGLEVVVDRGPYPTAGDAMRAVDAVLREIGVIG